MKASFRTSTNGILAALALAFSCSTDESAGLLTIRNDSRIGIAAYAFAGDGSLVDPVTQLPAGSYDDHLVLPGRRLVIDTLPGYQAGMDVTIFVYEVLGNDDAKYSTSRSLSNSELQALHGIVSITILPTARDPHGGP
jgi:hypothetical protein